MSQEQKDSLTAIISILTLIASVIWFFTEPKFETFMLVLSTIATTLTLYASKKKIEKIERRYITKPKQLFEVSVALWGPRGSGKSWLMNAFAKTLKSRYNKEIEGLHYQLEKLIFPRMSGMYWEEDLALYNEATSDTESIIINFERSRTTEKYSQSISSFKHRIQIFDHPGDETTGRILIEADTEENHKKVSHIALNLAEADIVIIALDHKQFDFHKTDYSEPPKLIERAKRDYVEYLSKLFSVLENIRPDKKRYYAICLMKSDTIDDAQFNHPDGLIELMFGKKMLDVIKSVDPKQIKTFIVSSFGFLPNSTQPNREDDHLRDIENWTPFGVEFPLFWAFEELEKQNLLEKFSKSFWGKLTSKYKIKKYIQYPKLNYDL